MHQPILKIGIAMLNKVWIMIKCPKLKQASSLMLRNLWKETLKGLPYRLASKIILLLKLTPNRIQQPDKTDRRTVF
jgi:hypothetical protein